MQTPEKENQAVIMEPRYMSVWCVYDFELCEDLEELKKVIATINRNHFELISVTQDPAGVYTVFFKRRACG